jgi:hypothetical protein
MAFLKKLIDKNLSVLLILFVIGTISYFNVIKGPFFFDDEQFIEKNDYVHNFDIKKIYTSNVTEGAHTQSNFYRPNQQFVFSVLYKTFGPNADAFHFNSILFHIINSFLLFLLLILLGFNRTLSFVGCTLFLIHPIQTESVAYISGFADVLGLFFLLSGLIIFIYSLKEQYGRKWLLLLASLILYLLALFSKESMVILFPLTLLVSVFYIKKQKIKTGKFQVTAGSVTAALVIFYLLLKFSVFNFSGTLGLTNVENVYTEHLYVRIFTFIHILPEYLKMFFFPGELYYGKPYAAYIDLFSQNSLRAFIGLMIIGIVIFALIKFDKHPYLALGSGWFLLSLSPFSGIIPLNAMYLEHWIYIPAIGLIILILSAVQYFEIYKYRTVAFGGFVIISVLCMIRVHKRNEDWANPEKFYLNEIKHTKDVRNCNNLGMYYAEKKDYRQAIEFYQMSVQLNDVYPQPHYNLANIYIAQNNLDKALNELYLALKIDHNFFQAVNTLKQINDYRSATQDRQTTP